MKAVPAVLQLPIGNEADFLGVIDLITMTVSKQAKRPFDRWFLKGHGRGPYDIHGDGDGENRRDSILSMCVSFLLLVTCKPQAAVL